MVGAGNWVLPELAPPQTCHALHPPSHTNKHEPHVEVAYGYHILARPPFPISKIIVCVTINTHMHVSSIYSSYAAIEERWVRACLDQRFFIGILGGNFSKERNGMDAFGTKDRWNLFQRKGNVSMCKTQEINTSTVSQGNPSLLPLPLWCSPTTLPLLSCCLPWTRC